MLNTGTGHLDSPTILEALESRLALRLDGTRRVSVDLERGATAWNPSSTREGSSFSGPATVRYVMHPDGGIDTSVTTY